MRNKILTHYVNVKIVCHPDNLNDRYIKFQDVQNMLDFACMFEDFFPLIDFPANKYLSLGTMQ